MVAKSSSDLLGRYEALRTAVLAEGLAPESRYGLALFLRRGMWGWMQASAAPMTFRPTALPSRGRTTSEEHQTVIHLFADLAMGSAKRSAHERFS
jgi:hypothetical protein